MSRKFGMVSSSIWQSEKFAQLDADTHRLAYLYLCTCQHGNALGCFRLPPAYLEADFTMGKGGGDAALAALSKVDLIRRGTDDQIRIVGWFRAVSGASNPSTGSNLAKMFADRSIIKPGLLRTGAILEMIHATMTKATEWNPTTDQIGRMFRDFQNLLTAEVKRAPELTATAFTTEGIDYADPVWKELVQTAFLGAQALYDTLGGQLSPTLSPTVSHTLGDTKIWKLRTESESDTENEMESDTERDRERDARGKGSAAAPRSSTSQGVSRGGRTVSEETKKLIASIGKKA